MIASAAEMPSAPSDSQAMRTNRMCSPSNRVPATAVSGALAHGLYRAQATKLWPVGFQVANTSRKQASVRTRMPGTVIG